MKTSTQHSKSGKVNKAWLYDHINDPYVKLANREGYRTRAAYKLKEIDEALGLIAATDLVVDLGCAPGAWSQYVQRMQKKRAAGAPLGGPQGNVIALDILPMVPLQGVNFLQGDFREADVVQRLESALAGRKVDVVLSDMAPNLSGIDSADAARAQHLVELAVSFACSHLTPGGALVAKVFHGSGYGGLVRLFKTHFKDVRPHKPKASRDRSAETFLIGRALRNDA
jgi:23S rRNA (uridine2552-2'-O)-methyltransferase